MSAARYNVYWYLSLIAPVVFMLAATWTRKRWHLVVGIILSLGATYALCVSSVVRRWELRWSLAVTDAEKQFVANSDGGNLVGSALIIAPLEAIIYTTIWGYVGWWFSKRIANRAAV